MNSNQKITIKKGHIWKAEELPFKSIALDGAIRGPLIDLKKKIISFDHHDFCIRSFTKATCEQVLDVILLDFDPTEYHIYINDIDGDTLLAIALLLKPELAKKPWFYDLVKTFSIVDALGSSYPLLPEQQKKYDWFRFRACEKIFNLKANKNDCSDLKELLISCLENLFNLVENNDFNYEEIKLPEVFYEIKPVTNKDWIMVKSKSRGMTSVLYGLGYNKYVLWQELDNGKYSYTIAKKSDFVDFPVEEILKKLALIEKGWSGGSTIGGSPRPEGSILTPKEVAKIINEETD